ncbi:MAG: tRNA(Ile)-lysidine synthase [Planctomycetes bacterium]|nr:tRNA(Ile)-lysidine synthase [Planctomycetota bacterium]
MTPPENPVLGVARSVPAGERVLAACSGGSDSVALLQAAAEALGAARVVAGHVDHGLRPDSADDAEFVRRLAARLGIRFRSTRLGPIRRAGRSPEDAAREARRAALLAMCRDEGCEVLLLAHQMDDVAETVLMRISTGTGPAGLSPMSRPPDGGGVQIVRPFLELRREALRNWLAARGGAWRDDPTNVAGNLRAVLRNEAIPLLSRATRRDVVPLLARSGGLAEAWKDAGGAAAADAWIERPGEDVRRLAAGWSRLPDVVRTDAIRRVLRELGEGGRSPLAAARRVDAALRTGPARNGRVAARRLPDGSAEFSRMRTGREPLPRLVVASGTPSSALLLGHLRAAPRRSELLDADALERPLRIRRARPGDRFHALGGPKPQRLVRFLQREGVPADARGVAVVTDGSGRIAWVVGHRIAAWCALTPDSGRWLHARAVPRAVPRAASHAGSRAESNGARRKSAAPRS